MGAPRSIAILFNVAPGAEVTMQRIFSVAEAVHRDDRKHDTKSASASLELSELDRFADVGSYGH